MREAVFGNEDTKARARWLLWEIGQRAGVRPASIHELYMARGRDEVPPFTTPAMNVRILSYDTGRAIFRAAKRLDAGAIICEIARSEIAYTDQRPAEYVAVMTAAALREGVSDPAPATPEYRKLLREWYEQHPNRPDSAGPEAFDRFVEAQLLWDRAFAEALFAAAVRQPGALVGGIVGSGHLRSGYGVSHQLNALGAKRVKVWLPVAAATPCDEIAPGMADAVFAIESGRAAATPRLGVLLEDEQDGPRVREVVAGSVAERAGVQPGDRLLAAAGLRLASAADLIYAVKKQPPGTWLPLKVERSGQELDLVAKFPAAPE